MLAQTTEHFGWAFDPRPKYKWVGQVGEVPFGGFDLAQGAHSIKRAAFGRRRENRHTAPSVRDLNRFASSDASQELAGSLSEFADADRHHVLLIAQSCQVPKLDGGGRNRGALRLGLRATGGRVEEARGPSAAFVEAASASKKRLQDTNGDAALTRGAPSFGSTEGS